MREQRKAYDDSIRDDDTKGREQSFRRGAGGSKASSRAVPDCAGTRLKPGVAAGHVRAEPITTIAQWSVGDARLWVDGAGASPPRCGDCGDVVSEIKEPLEFLERSARLPDPDRAAPTLSGGEAQRIRLAAQLAATCRRVLCARRADHRAAPARQPGAVERAADLERQGHTRSSWSEHDEDTIRVPTTSSTLGRARQTRRQSGRAGEWRARSRASANR